MTERDLEHLRTLDAILFGALGHPDVPRGLLERNVILGLRFGLDLYVNLRPVRLYAERLTPLKGKRPQDIDMLVIRENTEDVYAQAGGLVHAGTPNEVAIAEMVFTRAGVERVIRYGFERALERRGKLTLVDKSNAIAAQDRTSVITAARSNEGKYATTTPLAARCSPLAIRASWLPRTLAKNAG